MHSLRFCVAVPARRGHVEGRVAVEEAGRLSMNEGLRVSMGGYTWARVQNSARRRAWRRSCCTPRASSRPLRPVLMRM